MKKPQKDKFAGRCRSELVAVNISESLGRDTQSALSTHKLVFGPVTGQKDGQPPTPCNDRSGVHKNY